jgi:hypothetical protein
MGLSKIQFLCEMYTFLSSQFVAILQEALELWITILTYAKYLLWNSYVRHIGYCKVCHISNIEFVFVEMHSEVETKLIF